MGIFSLKSKTGDAAINLPHHSGVPWFTDNWAAELILHDDERRLEIRPIIKTKTLVDSVYLPYDKIVGVIQTSEKEIVEKSKSVLGRAVLGGVLLGPLGAVVGSVSGTGKKVKTTTSLFVVINYKPSLNDDEIKVISFHNNNFLVADKFVKLLKERSPAITQPQTGPITL